MDMVEKLTNINKQRDNGEISADEAEKMKYKLVKEIEGDKEEVFDKSCST